MQRMKCENCKYCKKLKLLKRRAIMITSGHVLSQIIASIDIEDDKYTDSLCCTLFMGVPDIKEDEIIVETIEHDCCEHYIKKE